MVLVLLGKKGRNTKNAVIKTSKILYSQSHYEAQLLEKK